LLLVGREEGAAAWDYGSPAAGRGTAAKPRRSACREGIRHFQNLHGGAAGLGSWTTGSGEVEVAVAVGCGQHGHWGAPRDGIASSLPGARWAARPLATGEPQSRGWGAPVQGMG